SRHDLAPTLLYSVSLHDALPISGWTVVLCSQVLRRAVRLTARCDVPGVDLVLVSPNLQLIQNLFKSRAKMGHGRRSSCSGPVRTDRKSTRLNSSHVSISYAVFCL